eukprot:130117-Rhodomonas_salina.2
MQTLRSSRTSSSTTKSTSRSSRPAAARRWPRQKRTRFSPATAPSPRALAPILLLLSFAAQAVLFLHAFISVCQSQDCFGGTNVTGFGGWARGPGLTVSGAGSAGAAPRDRQKA